MILFWAVWYTVVFATNAFDGLKALNILGEGWKVASGNWRFLKETTSPYSLPGRFVAVLFAMIVVWEGLTALLLWRALQAFTGITDQAGLQAVYAAFGAGLAQFAVFMIADEIFLAYPVEATHMRAFLTLLASLLAIRLLPDGL